MENKAVLVEDNSATSYFLPSILENQGIKIVDQMRPDHISIDSIKASCPNLIIIDTGKNSNKNWIQLAQELQKKEKIPILILSNYPDELIDKALSHTRKKTEGVSSEENKGRPTQSAPSLNKIDSEPTQQNVYHIQNGHYSFFNDIIFVKNEFVYQKIKISELKWVEASRAYCEVVTNNKRFVLSINLNTFNRMVQYPSVIRVHRSYIINVDKIDAFEGSCVYIDEKCIPIGTTYRQEFTKIFPFIERSGIVVN